MRVDLWSDVVCPFCYLGSRQLALALERFEHGERVEVVLHAFELDPRAAPASGCSLDELIATKYGLSLEQARGTHERMTAEAAALQMTWHLEAARPANTFDAHRVIALAKEQGRASAMSERLFRAYFSEGELISDPLRLEALAGEVGVAGVAALLAGDRLAEAVRADEAAAQDLGVSGVPAFLIDGTFLVLGAQGADHFLAVLRRAWARREAVG